MRSMSSSLWVWVSHYINIAHTSIEGKGTTILHLHTITNTHTHSKVSLQETLRHSNEGEEIVHKSPIICSLIHSRNLVWLNNLLLRGWFFYPSGLTRVGRAFNDLLQNTIVSSSWVEAQAVVCMWQHTYTLVLRILIITKTGLCLLLYSTSCI